MKFLVTEECGRLARWLRLMGYDAALATGTSGQGVYQRAFNEGRIVVTRNRRVRTGQMVQAVHLGSQALEGQLRQLIQEGRITVEAERWLSRCDCCNVELSRIDKAQVKDRVPPYVLQTQQAFFTCPSCQRVYWTATHWHRIRKFLDQVCDA